MIRIRRALLSVTDKSAVAALARALEKSGAEIVATGRTAHVLKEVGLKVTPIEAISKSPEAFQGRMKTLSFPVLSGILYRRGDAQDEKDLERLGIVPIDCVVVNFYPFEEAARREGITERELIEEIDIGGPALVRAAAKNAAHVLVLTDPAQYARVMEELEAQGGVSEQTARACARTAWDHVLAYDQAIAQRMGNQAVLELRYGENPHQEASLQVQADSPIVWPVSPASALTPAELSYNNILDLTGAFELAAELRGQSAARTSVVIVKHNNPCGVASVEGHGPKAQLQALQAAWEGDPVSAFGGIVVFTDPLTEEAARWLAPRFVECVAAPELTRGVVLSVLTEKRKNLKAVSIRHWNWKDRRRISVPGGFLEQTPDGGDFFVKDVKDVQSRPSGSSAKEDLWNVVTRKKMPVSDRALVGFGVAVSRALKSNAVALVRNREGVFQLIGAGQGQPNRVEALELLAIPRARRVLAASGGELSECVLVSDAFFPFRDTVDAAAQAGICKIVQPGGSVRDAECITACDEQEVAMLFTGVRHFRH